MLMVRVRQPTRACCSRAASVLLSKRLLAALEKAVTPGGHSAKKLAALKKAVRPGERLGYIQFFFFFAFFLTFFSLLVQTREEDGGGWMEDG